MSKALAAKGIQREICSWALIDQLNLRVHFCQRYNAFSNKEHTIAFLSVI
jgi:hypothetical protein